MDVGSANDNPLPPLEITAAKITIQPSLCEINHQNQPTNVQLNTSSTPISSNTLSSTSDSPTFITPTVLNKENNIAAYLVTLPLAPIFPANQLVSINSHHMLTRIKIGTITRPTFHSLYLAVHQDSKEPHNVREALAKTHWVGSMNDEILALKFSHAW